MSCAMRQWHFMSGTRGIDYALLRPCSLRFADEMKVLRFAKFGSQTLLLHPDPSGLRQGILGPPPKRHHPCPDELGRGDGGGGGIRTHGTFRLSSFQDWRNRPLYHPSVRETQASRGGRYALDMAGDQGNF